MSENPLQKGLPSTPPHGLFLSLTEEGKIPKLSSKSKQTAENSMRKAFASSVAKEKLDDLQSGQMELVREAENVKMNGPAARFAHQRKQSIVEEKVQHGQDYDDSESEY